VTNLLEQAISCDDGGRAAKIIQNARIIGDWLQTEARYLG
jgi:hypothetical protein